MKNLPLPGEKSPAEKIEEAFHKLNPNHSIHQSTMIELLAIGGQLYWKDSDTPINGEKFLQQNPPHPGLGTPSSKRPNYWKSCNLNTAAKEIAKIETLSSSLQDALQSMHATTFFSFVREAMNFREQGGDLTFQEQNDALDAMLGNLIVLSQNAEKELHDLKIKFPEWANQRAGRPKKTIALRIAQILAEEYYQATGKPPTVSNHKVEINSSKKIGSKAYGEFIDLVTVVFNALDLSNASPESMARNAEDAWKKRKTRMDSVKESLEMLKEESPVKISD